MQIGCGDDDNGRGKIRPQWFTALYSKISLTAGIRNRAVFGEFHALVEMRPRAYGRATERIDALLYV